MRQCPSCGGFCKQSGCERANVPKVALPCCGYTDAGAIKWNPYNQVVQCHNCGQVYTAQPQRTPPTDESLLNKLRVAEETLERCKEVSNATAECYRMDMERNAALIRQLVEALGLVMERIDRDIEPSHSWACIEREMAVQALAAAEAHGIGGGE